MAILAAALSFESLEPRLALAHFDTPFDSFPNFVETPDTQTVQAGDWFAATTWSNGVPTLSSDVKINHAVSVGLGSGPPPVEFHPGDFNEDTAVNNADYDVWVDTYGSTVDLRADGNSNGVVDYADLQPLVEGLLGIPWTPPGGGGGGGGEPGDAVAEDILVDESAKLSFVDGSSLSVQTLTVLGELEIGTAQNPASDVDIVFRDVPLNTTIDPSQYGNGLLVIDGKVRIHGEPVNDTFVRANGDILAGAATVTVTGDLTGWQAGDVILLPDTRQNFYGINTDNFGLNNRYEEIAIASISGQVITLATPTQFAHLGARDMGGVLRFTPHVARVGGNSVVLRSENPLGTRAHVMFTGSASDFDVRYATFLDLGRTTNAALNNTTFDTSGNVTHVGTNQIGRYPIHAHHVVGPATPLPNGYQFNLIGNIVHSREAPTKWPIAIHDSHYGLIQSNVVYGGEGFGIGTEDGTETGNRFDENFVARIDGLKIREKFAEGRDGSGIWLRRPNNYVENNVVVGATKAGYGIYGGDNLQVDTIIRIPSSQGMNPHVAGQYTEVGVGNLHLLQFEDNEAYASYNGVQSLYVGFKTYYAPGDSTPESHFKNFVGWHIDNNGIFSESTNRSIFDGVVLISNAAQSNQADNAVGINLSRATNGSIIRNSDIQNYKVGIVSPTRITGRNPDMLPADVIPFLIENNILKNEINYSHRTPSEDVPAEMPPRRVLLKNNVFTINPIYSGVGYNVTMTYYGSSFANIVQYDELIFEGYNGHDYRVYYNQQDAAFVVPISGTGINGPIAAPVAGLTNQQLWDQYGLAVGGKVEPATAVSNSTIKTGTLEQLD